MPAQGAVLRNQHVGVPVAGEIGEAEVGIAPVDPGQRLEWGEGFPVFINGPLVESRRRAGELRQVELAIAGEIEELLSPSGEMRACRNSSDRFHRPKAP